MRTRKSARSAKSGRSRSGERVPLWQHVFATIGMVGIFAASLVGGWLAFQAGGLMSGLAGLVGGAALGWGATYVIGNILEEMVPYIQLLVVLVIVAAAVYVLHLLGVSFGITSTPKAG